MYRRSRSIKSSSGWTGAVLLWLFCASASGAGQLDQQRFEHYSDLAKLEVIIERMYWTPERLQQIEASAARLLGALVAADPNADPALLQTPMSMAGHTVDLDTEWFDAYVPRRRPAAGYGLLVFIPPGPEFRAPRAWRSLLDTHGIILVTPRSAGNGHPVVFRRIPLALHARENMAQRFPIDPARTYIGGWSGGSRVALSVAIAYPDIFRGGLLIAGSDPVGDAESMLPNLLPTDQALLTRLRTDSRLVMLTGDNDTAPLRQDQRTLQSLREAGINGTLIRMRNTGHVMPDRSSLAQALHALDELR
ncbi:MAG: hypothetical protein JJU31_13785 [Wenzhouxiangella sp.]|nr:hypothetical protein [Wenzhouxiangella sp.]MCH8478453.1 hypothetical protein [Wenzhouxiangella sp.]